MGYTSGLTCFLGLLVFVTVSVTTASGSLVWLKRPQDASARLGGNVTFECRLNDSSVAIVWENDSEGVVAIEGDIWNNNPRLSVVNMYDLVIRDVQKEDDGMYSCKPKDAGVQTARLTVLLYPGVPEIDISRIAAFYREGEQITLTCSSTGGNPSPRIIWLKNGNLSTVQASGTPAPEVGGVASSRLTWSLDKSDHQANFSCLVHNELNQNNKLMASTVLNVQYSPAIGFRPYSPVYHVRKGDNIDLECDVDANPSVSQVTWYRDGSPLSGTNPSRTITDVQEIDGGLYNCSAQNSIGRTTGSLQLDVQYPPILSAPSTETVNEGEDINIECDIQANPYPYEIQWARISNNGVSRTVTNSATLNLQSVGRETAGNYSCIARSQMRLSGESLRLVSSEAFTYLYVQYKPGKASIGSVPDVYVGERLVLTCTASPAGYPEAIYVWSKDGVPLTTSGQMYSKNSVTLADNGRYACSPSNSQGDGEAASIIVNVYEPPTIVERPQVEVSVMLTYAQPITLTCVAYGYPEPQLTWYQEGDSQALHLKRDLFTVTKTSTLEGRYRVRSQTVLQFAGDARDLSPSGERTMLKIRDMGNYTCQAQSNKHPDTPSAVSRLIINFPPVWLDTPSRYANSRLSQVALLCEAQGNPVPTFQWFFRGANVDSSQQGISISYTSEPQAGRAATHLEVASVSDKTYGVYKCVTSNALGNTTQEISLSPKSPPEQIKELTIVSISWESVVLSWKPGFDGGYDQRFFINQSSLGADKIRLTVMPQSATSFNVSNLRPSNNYTFRVVAANRLGFGLYSAAVIATTNDLNIPTLPDMPVYNVKQHKLLVMSPSGNQYCLRVQVRTQNKWESLHGCSKVVSDTMEVPQRGVTAVNVSVCLIHRMDVCGQPIAAEIHSAEKDPVLTEEHVIIIACICACIIVTLLVVLFCFICRRRRNAAKASQAGNAGDPPPYQAVAPAKKPQQGYDNQDGPLEFYGGDSGGADSNTGAHPYNGSSPGAGTQPPRSPMRQLSPRSLRFLDHHQFDNELNWRRENNNRMDNYPNRDMSPTAGSGPHSPTKDKYIDLQDRGGMDANDQGYAPTAEQGGGKPKKRIKWRWLWRKEKPVASTPPAFSHDPPGHTCGLPCCQQDNDMQVNPVSSQRGCVMVPVIMPLELSESNFVMKRALRPTSLFGHPVSSATEGSAPRMSKSMQDVSHGDTISDDEYEEDSEGGRLLKFKRRSDVIAPEPSAERLALHGLSDAEESATLLRRRKQLASWERIKNRHFTLPDLPRTHHRIMFLNHTPGESSDCFDNSEARSGLNSLVNTLTRQREEILSHETSSVTKSETDDKEDESTASMFSVDPSVSELAGEKTVRRSIVEMSLPPLPLEDKSTLGVNEGNEEHDDVDDDDEDGEHIYDVVMDVKAESEKLAKVEEEAQEKEQVASVISSSSVLTPADSNSLSYQASVSDTYNYTESYIYNGSLFSQCTGSSTSHQSIYYSGSLLRHRHHMDIARRPMIFMLGGKPVILPKTEEVMSQDSKLDSCSTSGQSGFSSQRNVPNPNVYVSSEKESKSSNYDSSHRGISISDLTSTTPADLDSKFTTKLKLWDLRLLTINREENQYSTFPPRNPVSEDLCVGFFTRCPEFGYRHRHHSDVTTDHYVTHKIQRILRAPVLTKSNTLAKYASGEDHLSQYNSMTSRRKLDPLWDNEEALQRWKQALILDNRGKMLVDCEDLDLRNGCKEDLVKSFTSKSEDESGSSIYEPVTLSGIYQMGEKREEDSNSLLVTATHRQHVDSLLVRKGSRKLGSASNYGGGNTNSYAGSVQSNNYCSGGGDNHHDGTCGIGGGRSGGGGGGGGGSYYSSDSSSVYGGSLYGSTFGWVGEDGQTGKNRCTKEEEEKGKSDADRPVIWGDPSVVDWRHQAHVFQDKSFVTLIL